MNASIKPNNTRSVPVDIKAQVQHAPRRRGIAIGSLFAFLLSSQVLAGGADVSDDELYSDGVTLTTYDGSPLDINGDGNVDLAVAAKRSGSAESSRYYPGNGDGTFSASVSLKAGSSSEIAAGDMTGDLVVDLVQGRRDLTDILHVADGSGGFAAGTDVTADTWRVLSLDIGDLDGDGDLDIVTGNGRQNANIANPPQPNRFYVNDGMGNFTGADISPDADDTRGIALADIDNDGFLDVLAGNDETTDNSNRIYLNQTLLGALGFAAGVDFGDPNDQTGSILTGDLDNDGDHDIVVLNHVSLPESPGTNRFFINDSTPAVLQLGPSMDVSPDTDDTSGGALADFDGDGDLDLAVANLLATGGDSSRTRLYLNQFIENGSTTVSFSAGTDVSDDEQMSRELAAADIDGDGDVDIIVGNQDDVAGVSGRNRRYLNNGTAAPFTNVVPVIDDQAGPLDTDEQTDLTIVPDDVLVTDPDNVFPADFTLTVQAGDNYTFTDNTITPDANFDGDLTVPVIVNDGTDDSDPFDLTVTVNDTMNTAPSFTSVPPEDASEGVLYTYDVSAADPDISDVMTITAPVLPAWLTLTDNGDGTATLEGTPDDADAGDHDVTLEVSDGTDAAMQAFSVTVTAAAPGNSAPSFTSDPIVEATEGAVYEYEVTTEDADAGDTLTISAPTLPAWLTLTDNGDGTAALTGTPADTDVGDHDVSLQVSDGTDTAVQAFTVTVEPEAAEPPPTSGGGGGGGGSYGLLSLLTLLMFTIATRRRRRALQGAQ